MNADGTDFMIAKAQGKHLPDVEKKETKVRRESLRCSLVLSQDLYGSILLMKHLLRHEMLLFE